MSALPPIADIDDVGRDVRFVPKADIPGVAALLRFVGSPKDSKAVSLRGR